jgi:hypothetical protein
MGTTSKIEKKYLRNQWILAAAASTIWLINWVLPRPSVMTKMVICQVNSSRIH